MQLRQCGGEGGYLPLQKAGLSRLPLSLYLHNPWALSSTLGNCLTLRLKGTALSSVLYRYLALLQHNAFQRQTISGAGMSNPVCSELVIHSSGAYGNVLICCVRTCCDDGAAGELCIVGVKGRPALRNGGFSLSQGKCLVSAEKLPAASQPRYCVM